MEPRTSGVLRVSRQSPDQHGGIATQLLRVGYVPFESGRQSPDQHGGIATQARVINVCDFVTKRRQSPDQHGGIATYELENSEVERNGRRQSPDQHGGIATYGATRNRAEYRKSAEP